MILSGLNNNTEHSVESYSLETLNFCTQTRQLLQYNDQTLAARDSLPSILNY